VQGLDLNRRPSGYEPVTDFSMGQSFTLEIVNDYGAFYVTPSSRPFTTSPDVSRGFSGRASNMSLELQRGKSKWWYARVMVNGRRLGRNLGVEVRGIVPPSLNQTGDLAFERSRAKAQAALEQLQLDLKRRKTAEELVQTIHEIRTGGRVRSIPLGDIAERWKGLPRRRPLSKRYLAQADSWMGLFVAYLQAHHPAVREMADIQSDMAQGYFRKEQARGISAKTYNNSLIFLRSCFGTLRKAGGLVENPFDGIPTREETTVFRKPFNTEELAAIVEAAKAEPFVEPIIITSICTAMRRGDCCMLLWSAVDLPGRFIRVKTSKTGELVQIPIFPLLSNVLSKLERGNSPYVFPALAAKYQTNPDFITGRVQRVMRTAGFFDPEDAASVEEKRKARGELHQTRENGLRKASIRDFHSFRVTWVTLALTAGVPLEIVQKVTGHRTAGIVMKHYFQPGREEFRRTLAGKLPVLIGGGHEAMPVDPADVRKMLVEMNQSNWQEIRDRLLGSSARMGHSSIDATSDRAVTMTVAR
jgi:integrase